MARKKKLTIKNSSYSAPSYKFLQCSTENCKNEEKVDINSISLVCSTCVQKRVGPPKVAVQPVKSDKPQGWHFMNEFVSSDGTVYHKGVEQPELKGTLPETVIEKKKKTPKKRKTKEERLVEVYKKKQAQKKKQAEKEERADAIARGEKPPVKKKRGRPAKSKTPSIRKARVPGRKPGRPRKNK